MLLRIWVCLLVTTVSGYAYTSCKTTPIGGPGAVVAEEGANPVTWAGRYIYAGFMQTHKLTVAVSSDWGTTLNAPVTVFDGPGTQHFLRLGTNGQHVYALWGVVHDGTNNLMFAASHDFGATWSSPVSFGSYLANLPQIAVDGDSLHVVYHASDGNMDVLNSIDHGKTFSAPIILGPGASEEVAVAAGGNVYVSWSISDGRPDTMMAVSHDNGKHFKVTEISANYVSGSNEPILAVDSISGRVSLVWRDSANGQVNVALQGVYLQSLDNGNTWSAPLPIDNPARQFMVADDGAYIYITYLKQFVVNGITDWHVYLAVSKDGGKTFPSKKDLSGPTGVQTIVNDEQRPIPWAWDGNGALRVTGVKADGVYVWNGRSGVAFPSSGIYLGPGTTATPAMNSVVWQSPNQVVSYAVCQ